MKAYKVFNPEWSCKDYSYIKDGEVIGTIHEYDGNLKLCETGFHFCRKLSNCFNYYDFNPENKVAEIEILGDVVGDPDDKEVTNKFKIIRELSWNEVLDLCNSGNQNSGNQNSGDWNSGNWNSGDWNSGNWNSGDWNSGYKNSGDWNSGNWNSGYKNSGDWNSGDWNSGYKNSGYKNSGDWNSGDWNSGYKNSGDWNSGDWNSGYKNSGYKNSGDWNSGYKNSGDWNSGDWNSGNWNSGNWNSGDWNSGILNTNEPDLVRVFNNYITRDEFKNIKIPSFFYFDLVEFIKKENATEEEKEKYKEEIETTGAFLKTLDYKEAWKKSYEKASQEDRDLVKKIPGFDKDLFFEITGIMIED